MQNRWIVPPTEGLIEPALAPEFFTDQIGGIEALPGNMVRIYYCVGQMPLFGESILAQNVLVAKVIRPIAAIAQGFVPMTRCLAFASEHGELPPAPAPFRPRLVR